MKYLRYILAISVVAILGAARALACGPWAPDEPKHIRVFRCCSPQLYEQWQSSCRFQDYEKEQNCLLWQKITSTSIPYNDIAEVVYSSRLADLKNLSANKFAGNKFAQWLSKPEHREDLTYLLIAKEIEELRQDMNDPWYYAYDGDQEHQRLAELSEKCSSYSGKRHAARYALQLIRIYIAAKDYVSCISLWENRLSKLPQDIVTDMIASYVGGAYSHQGNRDKAIELYTLSQDIGSLIAMKAWNDAEETSAYTDPRVKELEYIFNRFPNSPLLGVKLQSYVHNREDFVYNFAEWKEQNLHDTCMVKTTWNVESWEADAETAFYNELKRFAQQALASKNCQQKAMWNYALGVLYYLDGSMDKANSHLRRAERLQSTPFMKESIHVFRFLMDAHYANHQHLLRDLKWLDEMMVKNVNLSYETNWHYKNKLNWSVNYWQDVARKVLLGEVCPNLEKAGNTTLALQLANYASNRIYQISPYYKAYHCGWNDKDDPESYSSVITFDEYRKSWPYHNQFDYCSQFFEKIYGSSADDAAHYAERIAKPKSELDKFLNDRSYVDTDYIYDIVGTLYLREMKYDKAGHWLSKVAPDYQGRTNIAKEGYFNLDPFLYHIDNEHPIADSTNYKLRFAQRMAHLKNIMQTDADPNTRAKALLRYSIGLRNSFGQCWYLTDYGYRQMWSTEGDWQEWQLYGSDERGGFSNNDYAQKAYKQVDDLAKKALEEFTDPEQAAKTLLEVKNLATLMKKYPSSKAAAYIRTRCDNYRDYAFHNR